MGAMSSPEQKWMRLLTEAKDSFRVSKALPVGLTKANRKTSFTYVDLSSEKASNEWLVDVYVKFYFVL